MRVVIICLACMFLMAQGPTRSALLSAQVILNAQGTTNAQAVEEAFRSAGFAVGPTVGNRFEIIGAPPVFETFFGVKFARGQELPLQRSKLPPMIRDGIEKVVVTKPADLGSR